MDYHQKYLKYKSRYMLLKQLKNNNNLEGGELDYGKNNLEGGVFGYETLQNNLEYYKHLYNVSHNYNTLNTVPEKFKTYEIYLAAIKLNGLNLYDVVKEKPDIIDEKMCLEAVKKNASALDYVPDKFKSLDVCIEAVKNYHKAIRYVPDDIKIKKDFIFTYEISKREQEIIEIKKEYEDNKVSNHDDVYDMKSAAKESNRNLALQKKR